MERRQLEEYIETHGQALTGFCLHLTRSRLDAEDLFQETWVNVFRFFHRYDPARPFDKWLFTVCANIFKSAARKPKPTLTEITEETAAEFSEPDWDDELHTALSNLPPKLRLVTLLFYYNDYSTEQIAAVLKIPKGTVKSRLHTARNILREALSHEQKRAFE